MLKVAVVTPYYQEDDAVLSLCHESVLRQSYECHHILIADGHAKDLFETSPRTQHIRLPLSHGDNGNTPRAIGGILADRQGFDAVAYLDADNWYDTNHIEAMVAGQAARGDPLVACKRKFHDAAGHPLDMKEHEEEVYRHVDTSCWLVARPAFSLLRSWLMPKALSPVCDRIFFHKVLHEGLRITAAGCRTVNFRTNYLPHYQAAGAPVPPGAKDSADIMQKANDFLASEDGAMGFRRALGFSLPKL
ncbi:MAG: glycosyltransferase family A protein [Beijerinckiaceae bacterium]|jgi:glycosyltransferase involved in cell wall biosynthesis